jgi:uncharacterized membrane protein YbhN (UPF0104 family)
MSGQQVSRARIRGAILRLTLGVVVLALVLVVVDVRAVWRHLQSANAVQFGAAALVAIIATLCSALRWAAIARGLGSHVGTLHAIVFYARGITLNTLLPGATAGGDAFRAFQLVRIGNPLLPSAFSVLLDRLAGLWAQAVLSLAALAVSALRDTHLADAGPAAAYAALLVALVIAPWLPLEVLPGKEGGMLGRVRSVWRGWRRFRLEQQRALSQIALYAIAVALASTTAFWLCLRAVGLDVPYVTALAVATGIFLAGSIPLAVAGFGPRELGAAVAFAALGATAASATAASVLYGLAATLQGALAAPLFAWQIRKLHDPGTASTS